MTLVFLALLLMRLFRLILFFLLRLLRFVLFVKLLLFAILGGNALPTREKRRAANFPEAVYHPSEHMSWLASHGEDEPSSRLYDELSIPALPLRVGCVPLHNLLHYSEIRINRNSSQP